ncbi:hypothetical protein [Tranquillimonas alkanivorans]|uniref:Tyr recombinase domain-containing protein n=1 Tax=Tranquillimonas alkanivorans TaxID=441119 RepID=A0A1I5W050_9RHOB|nr:hypothetical protein [Tranquillimonas alkanivorans]SFQ13053.1 hypothetical protein SAMN04488047_13811 [Tranquillimonas alkanivorans]
MQHETELTDADNARLASWHAHLAQRGVGTPDVQDFLDFGKLSTLERLLGALRDVAPEQCGPLRLAIRQRRQEKRASRPATSTGGHRGPELTCSVAWDEVPADWRATIEKARQVRGRIDAGGLLFGDAPPAAASLDDMAYLLRALTHACRQRGWPAELRPRCVRAWLDDAEDRKCGARGLSLQIGLLRRFAILHDGRKTKLAKKLGRLRQRYVARGNTEEKRKQAFLRTNPRELGAIWETAERRREEAMQERSGSAARQKLLLEAAALALAIVVPLRIGDLHRFLIGEHLVRTASGWSCRIETSKTGAEYERAELWTELDPFLDALLENDAPGGELWRGYDARQGTPIFSTDGGLTGLSGDWISAVWEEHVGCGAHIVRTLWHQLAWEADRDLTWMALALCGQSAGKTAQEYRVDGARRQAVQTGRGMLKAARLKASG